MTAAVPLHRLRTVPKQSKPSTEFFSYWLPNTMPKFFAKVKKKWSPYLSDIPQVPLAQHRFFHFIPSPRGTPDVAVEFQFVALSLRNGVPPLPSRRRKRHTVYDARHFRGEHEPICPANCAQRILLSMRLMILAAPLMISA